MICFPLETTIIVSLFYVGNSHFCKGKGAFYMDFSKDYGAGGKGYTKLPESILGPIVLGSLTFLETRLVLFLFKNYRMRACKPIKYTYDALAKEIGLDSKNPRGRMLSAFKNLKALDIMDYRASRGVKGVLFSFQTGQLVSKTDTPNVSEIATEKGSTSYIFGTMTTTINWREAFSHAPFRDSNNTLKILYL